MVVLSLLDFKDQLADRVEVPPWVTDLDAFRRWMDSDYFPDAGHIEFIKGDVWVDMSKEQIFTHAAVKNEFNIVLGSMVKNKQLGLFFPDGVLFSNVATDIAVKPDALFVSTKALKDRVRILEGKKEGYVELEGSPDMVLEVVTESSVRKDTEQLRHDYWETGIREYWLVDARPDPLVFDILHYTSKGYRMTPIKDGWLKSKVFGKSFRLTCRTSALGYPEYTLEVR
jgi:Uma2 family endonuclease